jgi:hypothetical protein
MMSVLGAYWHRPILGKIEEVLKELKKHRKIGERTRNKGKEALEKEEKSTEKVTKWKNCYRAVGKWTSADLEQWLDRGPVEIKSRRKWTNLICLGLGFL